MCIRDRECIDNAEAPDGWTKWIIPSYEYIVVENHKGAFEETIRQMNEHGISPVSYTHLGSVMGMALF